MNDTASSPDHHPSPTKPPTSLWQRVKKAADENRTIAGAVGGFAAGTVVPGVGNVVGAIVGAGVGYFSQKEKEKLRSPESGSPK